jgi:hypothetical protein
VTPLKATRPMQVVGQAPPELGMAGSVSRMRKILRGRGHTRRRVSATSAYAVTRTGERANVRRADVVYTQHANKYKTNSGSDKAHLSPAPTAFMNSVYSPLSIPKSIAM